MFNFHNKKSEVDAKKTVWPVHQSEHYPPEWVVEADDILVDVVCGVV